MRCPKCGYHSFDALDACKKCSNDLSEFKSKYGLRSLLFPGQNRSAEAEASLAGDGLDLESPAAEELETDGEGADFGFDFMGDDDNEEAAPQTQPLQAEAAFDQTPAEEEDALSLDAGEEENALDFNSDWSEEAGGEEEIAELTGDGEEEPFSFDQPWDAEAPDAAAAAFAAEPVEVMESGADDFSFDSEPDSLPALESEAAADFSATEELPPIDGEADTTDWDPFAEPPAELTETAAKGTGEEPNAPFDLRGSDSAERAPADPESAFDSTPEEDEADPSVAEVFFSSLGEEPELESDSEAFDFRDSDAEEPLTPELDSPGGSGPSFAEGLPQPLAAEYTVEAEPAAAQQALFDYQQAETDADEPLPDPEPAMEAEPALVHPTAPLLLRLGAGVVDLLVLGVIFLLFLMAGELALFRGPESGLLPPAQTLLELAVPYFLVLFAVCFGYFTLFHFLAGQTVGKMFLRLRVEGMDGSPLSFAQAFLHSSGGLLCLLTAGIGFAAAGRHPQRQGWNDRLAATRVVRTR